MLSDEVRHWGEASTAAAAACLADGDARAAAQALEVVLNGSAPVLHSDSLIEALLVSATARDRLGDARGAEAAIERALGLAEPDAQLFPFVMIRPIELFMDVAQHDRELGAYTQDLVDR